MDFITRLPRTKKQNDSIMVVIDKLRKASHFILVKSNYKAVNIVDIFMKENFILHGIPKIVITSRNAKFTSRLWMSLFKGRDTKLNFSTTYHPQTYGQTKGLNQVLEDMLRMYVMSQPTKWEDYIHLVEFTYNNNYQASLKMSPFEVLICRRCKVPLSWENLEDRKDLGHIC